MFQDFKMQKNMLYNQNKIKKKIVKKILDYIKKVKVLKLIIKRRKESKKRVLEKRNDYTVIRF